jgi:hypothetical protein
MTGTNADRPTGEALLEKARRYFPGGALGTFLPPEDMDFVVARGQVSKVDDDRGRASIDYVPASGPMILGHGHPAVVEDIQRQLELGTSYYGLNAPAIELSEEIVRAVPLIEKVRPTGRTRRVVSASPALCNLRSASCTSRMQVRYALTVGIGTRLSVRIRSSKFLLRRDNSRIEHRTHKRGVTQGYPRRHADAPSRPGRPEPPGWRRSPRLDCAPNRLFLISAPG